MLIETARERFLTSKTVQGLQPRSIRAYGDDLRLFCNYAAVQTGKHALTHVFTPTMVEAWFAASLERGITHNTINRHQTSLREFSKWCVRMRLIDRDPMIDVPYVKKPRTLPRPFHPQERDRLLALPLNVEETALREILYRMGLRDGSIVTIQLKAIRWPDADHLGAFRLHVKGGREEYKPITKRLWPAIHALARLRVRQDDPKGDAYLFAKRDGTPWSTRMVADRVARWGAACDPPVMDCTPHRLRHTFASDLLRSGEDIRVIQKLLGHASLHTTQIYTQVVDEQMEQAVSRLDAIGPETISGDYLSGESPLPVEPRNMEEK